MALTPLPDPPQTADPANFATKADALVAALATMVTEINSGAIEYTGGIMTGLITANAGIALPAGQTLSGAGAINISGYATFSGVLATNATTGFVGMPFMAGTPSGTPNATTYANTVAMTFDTTAKKMWFYDGSVWRYVTFT